MRRDVAGNAGSFLYCGNNAALLPRAALMLTTEALVSELPEEKKEPAAPRGGHGMGDMY